MSIVSKCLFCVHIYCLFMRLLRSNDCGSDLFVCKYGLNMNLKNMKIKFANIKMVGNMVPVVSVPCI